MGVSTSYRGYVYNSYSIANVVGRGYMGGLVGRTQYGYIQYCYAKGQVTKTGTTSTTSIGGLVGYQSNSTASNSFWDTETTGQTTSKLGTGKTTEEMKTASTYSSWNKTTIWNIVDGEYPTLK